MPDLANPKFDTEQLETMTELLRAIAHPIRLTIIDLLQEGKQLTVSQIQKELGTEQAVASHHLIILKNKDVLFCRRSGKTILYSLKNENISQLVHFARLSV
jgi:ArsR family transcriptional regulator